MSAPDLTVAYITSRNHPKFDWFFDSLMRQVGIQTVRQVIVVDMLADVPNRKETVKILSHGVPLLHTLPKPNIWQGKHRITKDNWWAASNARNTAIALCRTDWLACMDDRAVLLPGWIETVHKAIKGGYIVAGAYEKRIHMKVSSGTITHLGSHSGAAVNSDKDTRELFLKQKSLPIPFDCGGEWLFGCNFALPIACALQVNGFPEDYCDSLSMEDVVFGMILKNSGFKIKYDYRMKMVEDRTPSESGPVIHRTDKGKSPDDKSHAVLRVFHGAKTSKNSYNLSKLRVHVLKGQEWPAPTAPHKDWYDGQPIKEFRST